MEEQLFETFSDLEAEAEDQAIDSHSTYFGLQSRTISRDQTELGSVERERLVALSSRDNDRRRINRVNLRSRDRERDGVTYTVREETGSRDRERNRPWGRNFVPEGFDYGENPLSRRQTRDGQYFHPQPPRHHPSRQPASIPDHHQDQTPPDMIAANDKIAELRAEITRLQSQRTSSRSREWLVIYKIHGDTTAYLSEPSWALAGLHKHGKKGWPLLRGNSPIANEIGYLRMRSELAFVVYKYYSTFHQREEIQQAVEECRELPKLAPERETIRLLAEEAVEALDMFMNSHATVTDDFPDWDSAVELDAPYLFWYQYRSKNHLDKLSGPAQTQLRLLTGWIDLHYNEVYNTAEDELAAGMVSKLSVPFLIRPGDVLVSKETNDVHGFVCQNWGRLHGESPSSAKDGRLGKISRISRSKSEDSSDDGRIMEHKDDSSFTYKLLIKAWQYCFEGRYYRQTYAFTLQLPEEMCHRLLPVTSLKAYPLRFAAIDIRAKLERRGQAAWKCRQKSFIECHSTSGVSGQEVSR